MLLERKSAEPRAAVPRLRTPAIWLALGTVLLLVTYHGRWAVPLAAWVSAIFLLRFTRTSRVPAAVVGLLAAYAVGGTFSLWETGLPVPGPFFALTMAFGSIMVVPYLLDRLLARRLGSGLLATLVFPTAMVGAEYVLAVASPLGTVVDSLAITQHDDLPLIQLAAVTGTYGISFLMSWTAPVVLHAWERGRAARGSVALHVAVLALVLVGGMVRITAFAPDAPTVRVAAVSAGSAADAQLHTLRQHAGSARALAEGDPGVVRPVFDAIAADLLAATEHEAAAGAKIVVWPETGAPVREADKPALIDRVAEVAKRTGTYVDAGLVVLTHEAPFHARNQAVLVDPQGRTVWTYDKTHPVPGMDGIAPGTGEVPAVDSPVGRLANVICFDADFPALMRQRAGVDLMLVPSNDWPEMGRTHTEKEALRAVENGYSLIRSDSHGVSGAYDPLGRTVASVDYFTTDHQAMVASVPTRGTPTIYGAIGDAFAWLCLAGLAALALVAVGRRAPAAGPSARHQE